MRLFKKKTETKQQNPFDQPLVGEELETFESMVWAPVHDSWNKLPDFDPRPQCPFCDASLNDPTVLAMFNKTFADIGVPTARHSLDAEEVGPRVIVSNKCPEGRYIRNTSIPVLQWKCECGAVTTTKAATEEYPKWSYIAGAWNA